jgi:predicted O-methyltransferase YrrM
MLSNILIKIKHSIWFLQRPKYYKHFFNLIKRKFLINHDTTENRKKAENWAATNSVSHIEALKKLGLKSNMVGLDNKTIIEAKKLSAKSSKKMGGSGHIHLIYDCVKLSNSEKVIETGVAYGWSSLAILKALSKTKNGKLFSIDMPYPTKNNDDDVGIVVPQYLKRNWTLIRKPDQPGILEALDLASGQIDLCHYDSDKSWWGRDFAYPILWKSLKSNGIFISDDIQDNLYFFEFVKKKSLNFAIVEFNGKFVGCIRKP